MLESTEVAALQNLIRDSFRVRENHDPVYVDIGSNLVRFASTQHQVLFGRRGSGKSCLLVHFLRSGDRDKEVHAIYVGVDEIKRLGFPDVLIRILLSIFQKLPGAKRTIFSFRNTPLRSIIRELTRLLDQPESAQVSATERKEVSRNFGFKDAAGAGLEAAATSARHDETTRSYSSSKLDHLERHLQDYKDVLKKAVAKAPVYLLVDDFYLIGKGMQPNVVDYLHRICRGTNAFLKIATIRHRTTLRTHEGQTIGVELAQDIEEISLDKTFERFESTHQYLHSMLQSLAKEYVSDTSLLFNPDASRALTLASGGVPRDFLNILVDAIDLSIRSNKKDRLTPTYIYKAASAISYKSKLANLKEEAGFDSEALERLFVDLLAFCLKERRKTAFLIRHEDAREHPVVHELLLQLMDFKLIHLVETNTSAASGRPGRYAAYTLDFSIFMEPRLRGIEIVEFWKNDEQRRPVGIRESPDYPLQRAADVIAVGKASVEELIESIGKDADASELDTRDPDIAPKF